jgi:hypothetical protein
VPARQLPGHEQVLPKQFLAIGESRDTAGGQSRGPAGGTARTLTRLLGALYFGLVEGHLLNEGTAMPAWMTPLVQGGSLQGQVVSFDAFGDHEPSTLLGAWRPRPSRPARRG